VQKLYGRMGYWSEWYNNRGNENDNVPLGFEPGLLKTFCQVRVGMDTYNNSLPIDILNWENKEGIDTKITGYRIWKLKKGD
jgi:hypothetical protein